MATNVEDKAATFSLTDPKLYVPVVTYQLNTSQEFRLKNIDKTRNYFTKETRQNELMSKTHKKAFKCLNYIELFPILPSIVTECISSSAFTSLIGITIRIASSAIRLKIYAVTAGIKKYKSIIKKKMKKKHDKILLLAKSK